MILILRCIVGVMVAALLTVGCASAPATRFYTLSVPSEPVGVKDASRLSPLSKPIFIEVMPVNVPERLARPQLVVRLPGSEQEAQLSILEQDRWSSHFNYELRDVFTTGITNRTGAINEIRGMPADQHRYRITIELSQFDAIVGEKVQARFGWTITRSTDGRNAACYSEISEPVGEDIVGVVKGLQRVVSSVVTDVSKNLIELETGQAVICGDYSNYR